MKLARALIMASALVVPMHFTSPMHFTAQVWAADKDVQAEGSTRALYLSLIHQARADGKARAALAYLDDFDRQHPNDREARILRVNCLLDLNQIAQAQTAVERIPASDRSGSAMAVRGHVLVAQNRWDEAVAAYTSAQNVSPADPYIGNALGYAQLRSGQPAYAVETLRRALDLAPQGDAVVRNNLALALTASGRIEEANALVARVRDDNERANLRAQIAAETARISAIDHGVGVQ